MNRRDHDQFHVDLLAVVASGCRLQIDDRKSIPSQSSLVSSLRKCQTESGLLLGDSQPATVSQERSQQADNSFAPSQPAKGAAVQAQPSSIAVTSAVKAIPMEVWKSSGLPRRYVAALQSFALTRQMTPVLDGLAVRYLAQEQLRRILYWPRHPGGSNFGMADGAIVFIRDDIDSNHYSNLGHRADGVMMGNQDWR